MEFTTTSSAVPFLLFRCSGEHGMLHSGSLATQSSQQSLYLFVQKCNKAMLGAFLKLAGLWPWFFCMDLLRASDGSSSQVGLLSRDPP